MKEGPRQPKNLEHEDMSSLAILGHIIELWESAANSQETIESRRSRVTEQVTEYLEGMAARDDDSDFDEQLHEEMSEDLVDFAHVTDEEAFKSYCGQRSDYYKGVRHTFIQNLLEK